MPRPIRRGAPLPRPFHDASGSDRRWPHAIRLYPGGRSGVASHLTDFRPPDAPRRPCTPCPITPSATSRPCCTRQRTSSPIAPSARWCSKKRKASTSPTRRASATSKALPACGAQRLAMATRNSWTSPASKCRSCPLPTCLVAAATSRRSNSPRRSSNSRLARPPRSSSPHPAARPTTARSSSPGTITTPSAGRRRRRSSAACAATTASPSPLPA
jgi:hypothetical protein